MQAQLITVTVNGEAREVPAERCVAGLLEWLEIGSDRVAVELNRSLVRKRDWENTPVTSGSQLEIVEFVGGG
jgi:sulfur carrier protein